MACFPVNVFLTGHKEQRKEGAQLDVNTHSAESLDWRAVAPSTQQ